MNPTQYPRHALLAAFNGLRDHGQGSLDRFATVDEAMASERAPLVRMHASLLLRGIDPYRNQRVHSRPVVRAPEPTPHPAHHLVHQLRHAPALLDHKRAAAGDRD